MPSSHVRVRTRALALLAAFVLTTPSALAEPRTPDAPLAAPVVIPNTVPLAVARPPAPIKLVESGGGFVAAGGISVRREPGARKFPGTATELATQRTEFSTVVANPNGTFTETLSQGRLNYKDANGNWQPIDVRLITRAVDGYDLGVAANDVDLRLSPVLGADRVVELAAGDYRVRIRVPGLATGAISTSADRLAFTGVGTDPGFEIIPTPEGFEFRAILADATTSPEVRVALQTVGLTPSIRSDGTIDLSDPAGKPIGRISAPAVIDAAGEYAPAGAITTTILDRKAGDPIRDSLPSVDPTNLAGSAGLTSQDNVLRADEVVVAYAIDPVWLAAKERVYPVVLDPSVCVAYGTGTGCTGPSGTRDVWITKGQPDVSPTVGPLRAGYDGTTNSTTRSEIYFPDVALTDGAVVTSATLQVVTDGNYSNRTLKVAPLNQPWPFGNGTWNNQPTHDATAELAFTPPAVSGGSTMTMDISPIVRNWYSRNPVTWKANSGVKLYLADESTSCTSTQACYRILFYALDGTAAQRPKLTINYLVHQARVDFDASLGADFAPATMPAGGTISLPVTVKNVGSGFTFNACAGATTNCYKVGYRWFDSMGKLVGTIGTTNVTDLPAGITSGTTSATIKLDVAAPATAGQYSLRTDLVWMWNAKYVFASDFADPSKYFARAKDPLATASNVRWVGTSVLARGDYPIAVVAGGGTGVGETKSVSLPDGSALGVNLWSKNLRFDGSGGVGFADLGTSLGLTWYYDSAFRTDCTSSVLGACGWGTNYDEGFLPGVNGADWIYRDPDGNRFAVDENADGQLVSGAGVRLDRYRATLIEDNNLTGWTGGTVSRSTSEHYAGTASISIATNAAASTTYGFRPVDVSHFFLGSFAAKATGATGVGIGFHVKNESAGTAGWLYYTIGTDFAIGGVTKLAVGGSVASWQEVPQRSVLYDLYTNGFGSGYDHYLIDGLEVRGNGTAGTAYVDSIRFEGRNSGIFSDLVTGQPAWTANSANATANTTDKVQGVNSIRIAPTSVATSPACTGCLTGGLNAYPYLRWAWKKVGGSTIAYVVNLKDVRTLATGTLTYYAGPTPPTGAVNPIQVAASIPDHWIYVTRNLLEDARQVLGFYNDHDTSGSASTPSGGPSPDDTQFTGYALVAFDGAYALFDDSGIRTLPDTGDQVGATTGDDFVATYRNGVVHRFNRDGRLVAIDDLDGNRLQLAWSYNAAGTSLNLDRIIAPADGQVLSAGTAQREIAVSTQAAGSTTVRFTEQLGSTSSAPGRYTEFQRTLGADLTAVIPARTSGPCAGSGATGCLKFAYVTGSYLTQVDDPRNTGTNNFTTGITWTAGAPTKIRANATGSDLFRLLSWDATTTWELRPEYQDANGIATGTNGYARYDDLSPNGSVLVEYAPVACTSANCATAPAPADRLVEYLVDGIDNYSTEIHYRTAGSTNKITTRRGTFAAAKVDNFSDPLTAGLTAWTQTADQYAASAAAGNVDLYRTDLTYNEFGQVTNATTPFTNPAAGTATQTVLTAYDAKGHVVQSSDATFITNPGFEGQLAGWTGAGTWTQTGVASGVGALQLTGAQTELQTALLLPGETFRFQAAVKAAVGSSTGYKIEYEKPGGTYSALLALTTNAATAWTTVSYDIAIPQDGTGRVRLTFSVGGGSGTAYVDDVAVFTRFGSTAYLADGRVDRTTDVLGRVTLYGYTPGAVHPAIFPTTVTTNYVTGQPATADQNVASTSTYDAWGRTLVTTDPDGVQATSVYGPNLTDVTAASDGLNNTTTFTFDEIGNQLSSDDPVHPPASTSFSFFGDPLDATAPDGIVTHYAYDGVGRQTSVTGNYVAGGVGVAGVNNVKSSQTYDAFGNVTRAVGDVAGGFATSDVTTDATFDLTGQAITQTVYEDGTATGPRTTTAFFNAAGRATGSRGPINPTATTSPVCPGSALKCNSVATLDMNGRTLATTDAYGIVTTTWYDFAGQPVRTVANYVDGIYSAVEPARDIISQTRYDTADHVVAVTDVLGHTTSTTYDNLDRIVVLTRADSSWIKTVYLPSGRIDRVSRPGAAGQFDTQVGWTKNLYDAAGRQTTTVTDDDTTGGAQFTLTTFESGTAEGFVTSANLFIAAGATVSGSSAAATGAASRHIVTSAATKNQGISMPGTGTFVAGHTYKAVVWAKGASSGQSWGLYLGYPSAGTYAEAPLTSTGASWQRLEVSWTPSVTYTSGVLVAFRGNREQLTANTVDVDDIEVWDTGSPVRHAPSITAFDAANQVVASIAAPAHAGEAPTVTTSAYDNAGRLTAVTVNAIAGAGTGGADVNLTTTTTYDALGDRINETDPTGIVTHFAYDRGAHVIGSTLNWDGVGLNVTATSNVTSLVGYNDRGETTVICAAAQVQADGCNPATGTALVDGWRYTYDAAGHVATDTPPANAGTALVTTTNVYDTANGGMRLVSSCDATSGGCASPARHTDLSYDELGRPTQSITYQGTGTGTPKLRTVTTYDGAGERTALDTYENGSGTTSDALTFGFDTLGRETTIVRAGSPVTTTIFNPDGSPATRVDHSISSTAMAFAYDLRGNLVSSTSPLLTGAVTETWRLDGLLEARSWPTGTNAGTFTYDGAKRPTRLAETTSGANLAVFDRTYDRNGTVGSETQTITGLTGDAAAGSQTFTYDPLRRITGATLAGSGTTKAYTYDANSNRITATEGGYLAATTYDRTGVQRTLTVDGYTATFAVDAYGNLTSSSVPTPLAADTTAPTTPTGLGATANGASRIDLAWTAATDAVGVTSYAIYRAGVLIMTVAGSVTAWSDRSLNSSTAYSYTVKAVDGAGNQSTASSAANATTAAGTGAGAITYVQDAGNQIATAATSMTVTLPSTPVAGDTLIATVGLNLSTLSVSSITGGGGTWSPVVTKTGNGTAATTWAAFNVAGGGSTTITITLSASGKGAASVAEFSGIAATSAVDTSGSVTGASTTAVSSGSATTTNANDLIMASVGWRTGAAPTASPTLPWANLAAQTNSFVSEAAAWQISSATGAYSAAWTLGASTPGYDGTIAAFKRVAGGDTTPPSVPTGLAVSVATSKQLNLTWTASTDTVGVQGYRVYRDGSLAATVGTNAFSDTGLAGGSAHTYTIAALDGAGNASAQSTSAAGTTTAPVRTTTYAYDLADRLTGITPPAGAGAAATLTLDALGRHRSRTAGGITETYTYAGESSAIVRISPSTGTTTSSVVDATGARLAVSTSSGGFGWTLADLHGDIAGYAAATGAVVTDATRYDPYGEVVAATSSGLGSPWGYQGRLDLAASTDTDLLDFGFRPYAPDLGTFTSPDDQAGSALNPLTFNRYLYAGANPATLVDPDGHAACSAYADFCSTGAGYSINVDRSPQGRSASSRAAAAFVRRHRPGGSRSSSVADGGRASVWAITRIARSTSSSNVRVNARAGGLFEDHVGRIIDDIHGSSDVTILRNKAIRDVNGNVVRIGGRSGRPDFQIIDNQTGRIVAIYEAKTGQWTYLKAGARKIEFYKTLAKGLGYEAPPVEPVFNAVEPRLTGQGLSRGFMALFILSTIIGGPPTVRDLVPFMPGLDVGTGYG